ncbi:hypothetical protein S40288_10511 [Stachybotrys chartarum IBT 40288]|nr:hypothetical protein S40288_10511 [Stachybotrys chartarum IBT 40288]
MNFWADPRALPGETQERTMERYEMFRGCLSRIRNHIVVFVSNSCNSLMFDQVIWDFAFQDLCFMQSLIHQEMPFGKIAEYWTCQRLVMFEAPRFVDVFIQTSLFNGLENPFPLFQPLYFGWHGQWPGSAASLRDVETND